MVQSRVTMRRASKEKSILARLKTAAVLLWTMNSSFTMNYKRLFFVEKHTPPGNSLIERISNFLGQLLFRCSPAYLFSSQGDASLVSMNVRHRKLLSKRCVRGTTKIFRNIDSEKCTPPACIWCTRHSFYLFIYLYIYVLLLIFYLRQL